MVRFAPRSCCGGHATSIARRCSARSLQGLRHLERVRGEVALGRAEVLAVEPHVAVVEDAVELEEPTARAGTVGAVVRVRTGEAAAVQDGSVVFREGRFVAPVMRYRNRRPGAVLAVVLGENLRQVGLGDVRRAMVPTDSLTGSCATDGSLGPQRMLAS